MATKCNYVRPDGSSCCNYAISGGKRCAIHRLDGGPKPLGVKLKHGNDRRGSLATNQEESLGETLLTIHRLQRALDQGQSNSNLLDLSAAIGRRVGRVFELLEREAAQGRKPLPLLQAAAGGGITAIIEREREQEAASHQRRVRYADTEVRSQRYWAVYGVIALFGNKYRRSVGYCQMGVRPKL